MPATAVCALVYESAKPGPDGSVSLLLTPMQLLERLAALIPPPRRHRHRYIGVLKNRVSIDDRPKIVDLKERLGDWEGDTVIGKDHKGAMVTLAQGITLCAGDHAALQTCGWRAGGGNTLANIA